MKKSLTLLVVLSSITTTFNANAENWFRPRADFGYTQFKQISPSNDGDINSEDADVNAQVNLLTFGAGATIGFGAWYVDLEYKGTADTEVHNFYNFEPSNDSVEIRDNGGIDRTEYTFTTGFSGEYFGVFGGVKSTVTEFDHELYYNEDGFPAYEISLGQPLVELTTYESLGVFVGASIQFILGESSALSIGGAYSQILEATVVDDWYQTDLQYDLKSEEGNGYSAQVTFLIEPFYIKGEYARYDYKSYESEANGFDNFGDITEEFTRVSAGIAYLF